MPTTVSTTASLSTKEAPKKRKTSEKDVVPNRPKKRAKRDTQKSPEFDNSKGDGSQLTGGEKKAGKKREKQIQHESEYDVDSDSENSDLEKAYAISSAVTSNVVESDGEDPVHETLVKSTKQRVKTTKRKHVPEDETPEMRDRRTIFVGNLPLEVLSKTVRIAHYENSLFQSIQIFSSPSRSSYKDISFPWYRPLKSNPYASARSPSKCLRAKS